MERSVCENETDPITMEEFSSMPPEQIVYIGRQCFHLPSIFDWLFNRGHRTNPYTNLNFNPKEIEYLKDVALERYPLKVIIMSIQGEPLEFQSCTLTSIKRLFMNVVLKLGHQINDSLYRAISTVVDNDYTLTMRIGETPYLMVYYLDRNQDQQLIDLGVQTELKIFNRRLSPPISKLSQFNLIRQIFIRNEFPTEDIDAKIRRIEQALRQAEEQDQLADRERERIRPSRDAYIAQLQEPSEDEFRINVQVNSRQGYAYGSIPLNVPVDIELIGLEVLLRDIVGEIMNLPDSSARYIYAGRMYDEYTALVDIPGIQNGSNITIAYM